VNEVRRALERVDLPGEHEARRRAWEVVQAGFAEREPAARARRLWRPALAFAVVAAVAAAALSPPGRALVDAVRETIGVEGAAPALFELPAEGRVLATSARGVWVVQADGSKRLLGRYREAAWSPFGRFVAVARANELAAVDPADGELRWSLSRPAVRSPRWTGTRDDTRIAYVSGSELRVVAGDGEGDRVLAPRVAPVAPAWRPGAGFVLAYATPGGVVEVVSAKGRRVWRSRGALQPVQLAWSDDGSRLLVRERAGVVVLDRRGRVLPRRPLGGTTTAAAFRPGTRAIAVAVRRGARSDVVVGQRRVFTGTGTFADLAWSPDGRWLLVGWRDADQWVLVRAAAPRRLEAVASISRQLRATAFPRVEGWCCAGG
jgi:hypothetical protein